MEAKKNPAPGRRTGSRLLEGGASLRRLVSVIAFLVDANNKKRGEVSSSVWGWYGLPHSLTEVYD
jgi:hypothetical protein